MIRVLKQPAQLGAIAALGCVLASSAALASSHREAPFIAELPKVDGTDFYMFRSYETGREGFVTLIANYQPLQDAYGGPNYFTMDPDALYEIHIDNNGDAVEDITFQFRFQNTYRNAALPIGPDGANVTIPLANVGPAGNAADVGPGVDDNDGLNVVEDYTLSVVRGDRRSGSVQQASNMTPSSSSDASQFRKPVDNIGEKTISDYATYAQNHVFDVSIPGCSGDSRVFVGQRAEGFVVNLGEVFDRINLDPLGDRNSASNIIEGANITSLALEVPASCLTAGNEPVIGGWTTSSLRQARVLNPMPQGPTNASGQTGPAVEGGPWTQVSRLGSPLVNEVVIGLDQKDRFNASEPAGDLDADTGFGTFVLYPTLPALVNALFDVPAPATPRNDLVAAFVTGIRTSVNGTQTNFTQPQAITDGTGSGGEMLRLNTAFPTGTDAVAPGPDGQSDLGFLACDLNGFPNGRRPIDDVVDIELSVAEGAITADNPNNLQTCDVSGESPTVVNEGAVVNDNAQPDAGEYLTAFPYLNTPFPGSPNPETPVQ
ncbi:DUF4331 domain-containing protein [Salinisphaera dokdonensis]|uniref:DUF4331 domain-containing protein n=1 Tax=Salinisphaera dokdonensis TaxID=454598 RepID=UPI003340B8D9